MYGDSMKLITKEDKIEYTQFLLSRFGGCVKAASAVDEILKFTTDELMRYRLNEVRQMLFKYDK